MVFTDARLSTENELNYLSEHEILRLKDFSKTFQSLVDKDIPYKKSIATIYSYLEFMDGIFKRLCPTLPNSVAKLLTEDKFLNLTSEENLILFFSFKPLEIDFFVKTRPAPLYVIGLLDYPSFRNANQAKVKVDGYYTEIGGFTHHDAEHARASWKLDSNLLSNQDPKRLVKEWQFVRNLLENKINQIKKSDPDLARAATILLFEILHERGIQFDLGILKSHLNLPLFSKTTKDKWLGLFWDPLPGKFELYDVFDRAEVWLDEQISELLIQQNKNHFTTGNFSISTIEKISMKAGFVQKVDILENDVRVWLKDDTESPKNNYSITSLYNIKTFGLVEIDRNKEDFVPLLGKSRFLETKFNQLLKLWKNNQKLSYKVIETRNTISDKCIEINENNEAVFEKDNQIYKLKLDSILIQNLKI